jgi:hypothetical protein
LDVISYKDSREAKELNLLASLGFKFEFLLSKSLLALVVEGDILSYFLALIWVVVPGFFAAHSFLGDLSTDESLFLVNLLC